MWKILKGTILLVLLTLQLLSLAGCAGVSPPGNSNETANPFPADQNSPALSAYPLPEISRQPAVETAAAVAPNPLNTPVAASEAVKREAVVFFIQYLNYALFIDEATFSPSFEYYGCKNSENKGMAVAYIVNKPLEIVRLSVEQFFQNQAWNYQEKQEIGDEENGFNGIMWSFSAQPAKIESSEQIFVDISVLESSAVDPVSLAGGTPAARRSDMRVHIRYFIDPYANSEKSVNKTADLINTCAGAWWLAVNP